MYGKLRPYLNKVIIAEDSGYCTTEILPLDFGSYIYHKYAQYVLMSPYFLNYVNRCSYGVKMPRLGSKDSKVAAFPLPPFEEQKRIVKKIEELFDKINQYDILEQKITNLNDNFPDALKNSILYYAVQGKLVSQNPNDESTSQLLENILVKKESLIKKKVIKKEKPLPPIDKEKIPFNIPKTWKWLRFGDIVNFNIGKTPPRNETKYWKSEYFWVSIADMINESYVNKTKEKVSDFAIKERFKNQIVPKGTLIMSFKLTIGKISILNIDAVHNEAIVSIYPFINDNNIMRDYLFKILPFMTVYGDSNAAIKGNTLNKTSLNNLLIPLPPLEEQKRIVTKIDELLLKLNSYIK